MDVSICLFDGTVYEVDVVDICDGHDLMLLKIKIVVDICDSHDLKMCSHDLNIFVGMSAYCISCPSSAQFSFSTGVVSYSCRDNFTIKVPFGLDPDTCFLQTNVATNTGSSGGGVFNSHGDMLGIHSQISEYVKLAVHIKTIIKFVESYKKSIASRSKSALNQPQSFGSHHQTSLTSHPKAELQSMRVRGATWRGRGAALCSRGRGRGDTRIASLSGSAPNQPRTFVASRQTSSTSHSESIRGKSAAVKGRDDRRIASLSGSATRRGRGGAGRPSKLT